MMIAFLGFVVRMASAVTKSANFLEVHAAAHPATASADLARTALAANQRASRVCVRKLDYVALKTARLDSFASVAEDVSDSTDLRVPSIRIASLVSARPPGSVAHKIVTAPKVVVRMEYARHLQAGNARMTLRASLATVDLTPDAALLLTALATMLASV
jgi:hypothetical protein